MRCLDKLIFNIRKARFPKLVQPRSADGTFASKVDTRTKQLRSELDLPSFGGTAPNNSDDTVQPT